MDKVATIINELEKRIEFVTDYQGHHEIITGLQIALAIAKKVNRDWDYFFVYSRHTYWCLDTQYAN